MKTLYKVNVINTVYVLANSPEEAEECANLADAEEEKITFNKLIKECEVYIASLETIPDYIEPHKYIPWTMEYLKSLPNIDNDDTIFQILNKQKENNAGNTKIPL